MIGPLQGGRKEGARVSACGANVVCPGFSAHAVVDKQFPEQARELHITRTR
jgi:hypothetical protein